MQHQIFQEKVDVYISEGTEGVRARSPIEKKEPQTITIGMGLKFTDYAKRVLNRGFDGGFVAEIKPAWENGYLFVRLEGRPDYEFIHESYFHCC